MNKKVNTLLFILCATLFNVFIAILSFAILLVLYAKLIAPLLQGAGHSWIFSLFFLAAIAVSILVYRVVLKFLLKKVEVEKYFDPLFVRKSMKKPASE
jgi:hypothetical protein